MNTWKITLEYDGTKYHGWQEQNNARTILGELRAAAGDLFGEPCEMQGSGRTDSGVHAIAQVMHLRVETRRGWKPYEIQYGLNDRIPSDIVILEVEEVDNAFHARHDAELRSYIYQIATRKSAFAKRHVWWVKEKLNTAPMMEAAKLLVGRHNFVNFAATDPSKPGESTIVHVDSAEIEIDDINIIFHITASHYLWKMVRRVVGALVRIGLGELTVEQFGALIEGKPMPDFPVAEWTAPASGLFLEKVTYPGDATDELPKVKEVVEKVPVVEMDAAELEDAKYVKAGTEPQKVEFNFKKEDKKSTKPPRREAIIPKDKFKPEPLITRPDNGPPPVRPPMSGGDRPPFRKPFEDRGGDRPSRPPYGGGGDRGGYSRPDSRDDRGGDRPYRKPFEDRGGDRPSRPPFGGGGDRPYDRGGDRPSRPPFGGGDRPNRPSFGDRDDRPSRPPYDRGGDRPSRPPFGGGGDRPSRPPYDRGGDRPSRPPFGGGGDRPSRPPYDRGGDRPSRPPFADRGDRPSRPPFGGGGDRPSRPPYDRGGDRPSRPPFADRGDRPSRPPFGGGGDRPSRPPYDRGGDRPSRPPFGDRGDRPSRPPFGGGGDRPSRPPYGRSDGPPSDRPRAGGGFRPSGGKKPSGPPFKGGGKPKFRK